MHYIFVFYVIKCYVKFEVTVIVVLISVQCYLCYKKMSRWVIFEVTVTVNFESFVEKMCIIGARKFLCCVNYEVVVTIEINLKVIRVTMLYGKYFTHVFFTNTCESK